MDRNGLRTASRRVVLCALLAAVMAVLQVVMAPLPNIEPVSLLVMEYAVCLGWRGLYPVYLYVLLETALWGFGPWSVSYLYVWLVLFILARLLRGMQSPLGWAALSGCFGLLFGGLCAPVYGVMGGWAAAWSWWVSGLPWDLVHGAGNFVLAWMLFPSLRRWLERLCRWYYLS